MIRTFRFWTWCLFICGAAGCGDNIAAVQRDFYNGKHEILDSMMSVVDENSAKRFNQMVTNRYKEKADNNKERFEKIRNNQFTNKDREAFDIAFRDLNNGPLKGQRTSAQARLLFTLNRVRKAIVKMAEEKAEEAKKQNQSFVIKSKEMCPNMTALEGVGDFAGLGEGGTQGMMIVMPPMGGMPGMGGGPPGQPAAQADEKKIDPRAYQYVEFVLECRRTEDPARPWDVNPSWRVGSNPVPPLVVNLNGRDIDLLPLTSN